MLEIFQFDFMVRAFAAGLAIAVVAPIIGMFLVVRRYSLMADTLAHISLAGVAGGLLLGINPIVSAIVLSVAAAFGIEELRSSRRVFGESVLALFLSGSLAVAVIILSLAKGFNSNLFSYLFGSISTVSPTDLWVTIALAVIVLPAVAVALSIRIVGVLLIGALMVIPVISAMQYSKGFRTTLLLSVAFSLI